MSRPGNIVSMCVRNFESIAMTSSKCPCVGQSLIIQISPSRSIIWALISPTFSLISTETSCFPLRISSRASITQFGHKESVTLGQPRVGLVFCQDFKRGLSDHFGVNDGLGLYLLTTWMALKSPLATIVSPRSACLIAFISYQGSVWGAQLRGNTSQRLCQPNHEAYLLQSNALNHSFQCLRPRRIEPCRSPRRPLTRSDTPPSQFC